MLTARSDWISEPIPLSLLVTFNNVKKHSVHVTQCCEQNVGE